ncbi:MAG TPA: SRPBCC domain-containing protein, partial [Methyloceanibacter sp.]|nr:SRPBCC domain-containing protein [Methyloceanibacter sp.]
LSFKFGEAGEVTFELAPKGKDVLLVLTHSKLKDRAMMVGVASGWHSHLAILVDVLKGDEPHPFWTTVTRLETEYEKRIPQA